jgi:predicted dienelactone hydrolase
MTFERTDNDGTARPLDTWIWYPAEGSGDSVTEGASPASNGPYPLVIFSHGSGGQPNNATFLTEHLASWGYVVVAPPHPGNTSDDCVICPIDVIIRSASQRLDDVPFVLNEVLALRDDPASALGRIIDGERTAIAGHSFGGWTAIFMAPGDRFDVSIALAPGEPRLALEPARKMTSPALIIAAEKDEVVNPDAVRDLVAEIPEATGLTYVSLPEGHHLTFIDNCLGCTDALSESEGHALTLRYVTAFLQVHLVGDAAYEPFLATDPPDALVDR